MSASVWLTKGCGSTKTKYRTGQDPGFPQNRSGEGEIISSMTYGDVVPPGLLHLVGAAVGRSQSALVKDDTARYGKDYLLY